MKVSESWIREWVNPAVNNTQLCDQITMLGLEVDGVDAVAGQFSGVVVGEVVECEQHPNADKLRVTKVNVGGERLLDIVCGAPNCRQGLKVACATVGAVLPGDFKIKAAKLRGEPSEGMLCSFGELGIDVESDGIIELPEDAPIGANIRDYLDLDDQTIEISLTPNRADCLSILGVAREVAVVNNLSLELPSFEPVVATISDAVQVDITAKEACPRYVSRVIKNVNVNAPTPLWMREQLRRCGIRSIDPIVDVTNYILLELGQPMHAFNYDALTQPINVRLAEEGEKLRLLDGNEATLKDNTLLITDQNGPLAIAGIFGGEKSGVTSETQNIVLESAFFAPLAITGRARQYGLHTDASHRYERGVDYTGQQRAIERATTLILDICGGEAGPVCETVSEDNLPQRKPVTLTRTKIDNLLGHHIDTDTITAIFEQLGFAVETDGENWTVTPTSWRFDIEIAEDLIEEVARIYGYNNIPNNAPLANLLMREHRESDVEISTVKTALVNRDYQEAITYSFVDPKVQKLLHGEQEALNLPNPISEDMSAMRLSLMSGLLGAVMYNQNRQQNRVRLFETGLRFVPNNDANLGIKQEFVLAAVISGLKNDESWYEKSASVDFFDLKGDLEGILELIGASNSIKFIGKSYKALHPGQSAAIMLGEQEVGFIGTIHPQIAQQLDVSKNTVVFEILWDAISNKEIVQAKEISRFPANRRDIAIVVEDNIAAQDVLDYCKKIAGGWLIQTNLFDVYQGQGIAEGHKSLAISLVLQDNTKTLTENDISQVVDRVVSELKTRFNAYLRE